MLAEIRITDLALIDEMTLTFTDGLNVLTGETGTGKSMVVESISLLLGAKADAARVRRGRDAAGVEGLFLNGDEETVLRRRVGSDGRSRAYIDGRLVTVKELSEIGTSLIEVCGQSGHRALEGQGARLGLIDRFGGESVEAAMSEYRLRREEWKTAIAVLDGLEAAFSERSERRRFLEWRIDELEQVELEPGEDQELEERITRLANLAELRETAAKTRAHLDERALSGTHDAIGEFERAAAKDDGTKAAMGHLRSAAAELDEAAGAIRRYIEGLSDDSGSLEALQERLFLIKDLIRKYELPIEELIGRLDADRRDIMDLNDQGEQLDEARRVAGTAEKRLAEASETLTRRRSEVGEAFAHAVSAQLADLALNQAVFLAEVAADPEPGWGKSGRDRVEFLFSANPGEEPRSLSQVASGGESSRVMLAVKSVFGERDTVPTLLFDEIDAGVSGRTAVRVGEKLASLAGDRQVLAITHLASVAAFADHHLAVTKKVVDGVTNVDVTSVIGDDRLSELSRLGGTLDESLVSVEHAQRLVDQAKAKKR